MIDHLDHIVITTDREADCIRFYCEVLGMRYETFIGGNPPVERKSFKFGPNKINLHVKGHEFEPKAHLPVPGAIDLCFIASIPLDDVIARSTCAIPISTWSRSRSSSRPDAGEGSAVAT